METKLYDWHTDEGLAQLRRKTLADLMASLRDACDELHTLLSDPPMSVTDEFPQLERVTTPIRIPDGWNPFDPK